MILFINIIIQLYLYNFVISLRYDEKPVQSYFDLNLHKVDLFSENEFLRIFSLKNTSRLTPYFFNDKNVISSDISLNIDCTSQMWTTYYGKIVIGSNNDVDNTFNVLFDTGSSEFWLLNDSCVTNQCINHKRYHISKDWTPMRDNNDNYVPINIKYLSGDIKAIDGTTTINLMNGIILKNVNVGLATSVNIPIFNQVKWDGIVGLGFITEEMKNRGSQPIFEAIMKNKHLFPGFKCQISYYVSKKSGNITFGGINPIYKRNPEDVVIWSPVVDDTSYWTLRLNKLYLKYPHSYNENNIILSEQILGAIDDVKVIMDTGTYFIYAPKELSILLSKLHNENCINIHKMPTFTFELHSNRGSGVVLELNPEDYILNYNDLNGNKRCILGIISDEQQQELGITAWTFGEVFLRKYYTVYDYEEKQVGFVPSKRE